jgi:hypothetical protein
VALHPDQVGVQSSRPRMGLLAVVLASALVQCGGQGPTGADDGEFITVQLTPAGGDLTWEHGPGVWPIRFTPPVSWRVNFVSPVDYWSLDVDVHLLNAAGTVCFTSTESVDEPNRTFPYSVKGDAFGLPAGSAWYQGPCGNDFTIDAVKVVISYGHIISPSDRGGEVVGTLNVPCQLKVTRTGYPGGPPPN